MNQPTPEQIAAAQRLGVSLHFTDVPITIAKLIEIIQDLQRRVDELEPRKKASWSLRK